MDGLDNLLRRAEAADGLTRIELRDPIAAFGIDAVRALESWLADPRLAPFAVRTIERAAAQPGVTASARAALQRHRSGFSKSAVGDIDAALSRLGRTTTTDRLSKRRAEARPGASPDNARLVLQDIVQRWRSAGRPPQAGIEWPVSRWLAALPEQADLFRSLPNPLDRTALRRACANASVDARSAERALVAVMVWGHGDNGYAQDRTSKILSNTSRAADKLLAVARTLTAEGALTAYARLGDDYDCRLNRLGPAFGTKFLYFCQPEGQELMALIHDKTVSEWIANHAGLTLSSEQWSAPTYRAYLRQMHDWAADLSCQPDDVELGIFRAMAKVRSSQWDLT